MIRGFLFSVGLIALLGGCTQKLICPAYQSSFIYDKEAIRQKFSYFNQDSTPKILVASTRKNRYLVAVPESYRKKYRKMQTVEMKPVYPVIPDSLKDDNGSLPQAEMDLSDSTAGKNGDSADSIYAITKTKEKYNLDQDLYMWYFRDMLVLPDVRAALESKGDEKTDEGKGAEVKKEKEKEKGGFFKNLFKKKQKPDSTVTTKPPATTDVNAPEQPKKKGGLFNRKKSQTTDKKKEDGEGS